jgi:histidine triad (HIT) family protein
MSDCIFCKIINKEVPSDIIYEDDNTLAFLDIQPSSKGHTLVIPKTHIETLDELSDEEAKNLMLTVKKITNSILKSNKGCNILQNNKEAAGQVVPHVHFHVVPRKQGDGLHTGFGKHIEYKKDEKKEAIKKIQDNIS